jgi:hypothetical protein
MVEAMTTKDRHVEVRFSLPHEVYVKLSKAAEEHSMSVEDYTSFLLATLLSVSVGSADSVGDR